MATAPVKSQPLHNFSLPLLKWGKNQTSNHRCRKLIDSARVSPPLEHRSSASEAESDGGSFGRKDSESENRKCPVGSRSAKNRFSFSSGSSAPLVTNSQKEPMVSEADAAGVEEFKAKLLIRFRAGSKDDSVPKKKSAAAADEGGEGNGEESAPRPWNLRPRRAIVKVQNEIGGASKSGELQEDFSSLPQPENLPKSLRLRSFVEAQNVEKKEKQKFSISLSREEIEEDIFVMTGSKPSRRPKKRAKNIQKQLDNVFPGMWISEITPDSYSVPDAPAKG